MRNMGDSGTFGSRATMNAIGKAQQAKKPPVNYAFKGLKSPLKPKYAHSGVMGKIKKAAGKMFGL